MHQKIDRSKLILDRKIKVAVVGCGRISKNHFGAIEKHSDNLDLVAVCEADESRLQLATTQYGVPGYTTLTEALKLSGADLYVLCTPSGVHPAQAIEIASYGKHCVTEKPMATTWEDGVKMVQAFDQAGNYLFVVKQNRHNATLQMLKTAIDKGRFGKINLVNLNVYWTRPQEYYDQDEWRVTWEFDGGVLMNQASHYIDLLDWMIGPIESLHAYTGTLGRNIEAEDTAVMNIKWSSGALGSANVTALTYPKNFEGSITVLGDRGTVKIGGLAVNQIEKWEFEEKHPEDDLIEQSSYETTSVYGFGHPLYYDNVVKTLRGEAEPYTDGREGLKSLEILIAAYRSSKEGCRQFLPLEQ